MEGRGWDRPADLFLAMVTIGFEPGVRSLEVGAAPPLISWWDEIVTAEIAPVAAQP